MDDLQQPPLPTPAPAVPPPTAPSDVPPSPVPAPTNGSPADREKVEAGIKEIMGRQVSLGGDINNILLGPQAPARDLSPEHFKILEPRDLESLTDGVAFAHEDLERLEEILTGRRILVIAGEEEVGKGTMALLLASRLRGSDLPRLTLCAEGLASEVRVSLDRMAGDRQAFGDRTIVFEDAFEARNRDLLRFVRALDPGRLDQLRGRLEEAGTYVIFTSDSSRLPGEDLLHLLSNLSVLHELRGPGPDEVRRFLAERARSLSLEAVDGACRSRVEAFLEQQSHRLMDDLRTIPRIARFLDSHLLQILVGGIEIEQALRKFRHRADWLLTDLAEDPEAWSFVLALVLAQPMPTPHGVPWFQLQRLWHVLCRHLRRELRSFGPARLVLDSVFLEKVGAEVRRSPFSSDCVRFRAPIDPEALWEHLLGSGRALVGSVAPLLRELAEGNDFTLRECAARALGRIGRMDPRHMTYPLIHGWSHSSSEGHHAALGLLFQGILAARDSEYGEACLYQLRRSIWNGYQIDAGAVALREIGAVDLVLALGDLVEMLSGLLGEWKGQVRPEDHEVLRLAEQLRRLQAESSGAGREWMDKGRQIATPLLFDSRREQAGLDAVQYALVGLCFALDPVDVLAELRDQLARRAEGRLLPLLALLFLRQGGIADILERHKLPIPLLPDGAEGAKTVRLGELVVALSRGTEAVRSLARVVEAVFRGTGTFPGWICRSFRERLRDLLKTWARESLEVPQIRDACTDLFAELLASSDSELKDLVFRLLQQDPDFVGADKPLGPWAVDALTRRPPSRPSWRDAWTTMPTSSS